MIISCPVALQPPTLPGVGQRLGKGVAGLPAQSKPSVVAEDACLAWHSTAPTLGCHAAGIMQGQSSNMPGDVVTAATRRVMGQQKALAACTSPPWLQRGLDRAA